MAKVSYALTALGSSLAFLALTTPVQPSEKPIACLVGVPSWSAGEEDAVPTRQSFAALEALAGSLQNEGVSLFWLPEREAPLEVMASVVDQSESALFVGVRSLDPDPACVAVHVPPDPVKPEAGAVGSGSPNLEKAIRYADEVERARLSRDAADHIASLVATCPLPPDGWVEYLLSVSRGPTIVVEFRSGDGGGAQDEEGPTSEHLLEGVSEGIARFLGEAQSTEWRHQRRRFD